MRQLTIKLIRDLGNAVVVQVSDRIEVLPKKSQLYKLLAPFIPDPKTEPEHDSVAAA
jgi:hypothetical protein